MKGFKSLYISVFLLFSTLWSCSSTSEFVKKEDADGIVVPDSLEPLKRVEPGWAIPSGEGRAKRIRRWDAHHQTAWLRFDFDNRTVLGRTKISASPLGATDSLISIDAKLMEIDSVNVNQKLTFFTYNDTTLTIRLPIKAQLGDTHLVDIFYKAHPPTQLGLHFVDPTGLDLKQPTQIWTLGQPEDNSYWLPTFDHPSERLTSELFLHLPDSLTSYANGFLQRRVHPPKDSLRIDHWIMDKPHAPYLIAFAVGNFVERVEYADDVKLRYVAQPEYEQSIPMIYRITKPALSYFEDYFQVDYPWGVYTQIPVHEFAAGGMENTTATILFDGIQHSAELAMEIDNQNLIVHELAHQWFGDLVTAFDWSHLAIQEGFANFSEWLIRRHIQGEESAQYFAHLDKQGYFRQAKTIRHPIIYANYSDPYDLYDSHTYNKAARVLLMLEDELGRDAFRAGVRRFLHDYAYQSVGFEDFRQAMETASGRDLAWFFNQWYEGVGHPVLKIFWNSREGELFYTVNQVQDTLRQPVFAFDFELDLLYTSGSVRVRLHQSQSDSTFKIAIKDSLLDVIFDPQDILLAEVQESVTDPQLERRLKNSHAIIRHKALQYIARNGQNERFSSALLDVAKNDREWWNRSLALSFYRRTSNASAQQLSQAFLSTKEPVGRVRIEAVKGLGTLLKSNPDSTTLILLEQSIRSFFSDPSPFVRSESILLAGKYLDSFRWDDIKHLVNTDSYDDVLRRAVARAAVFAPQRDAFEQLKSWSLVQSAQSLFLRSMESLTAWIEKWGGESDQMAMYELFDKWLSSPLLKKKIHAAKLVIEHRPENAERWIQATIENERDEKAKQALAQVLEQWKADQSNKLNSENKK